MLKISVITPLYNKKKFIGETLKSLESQTQEDWEAIIVDDGSTDGGFELPKELARRDPRIRVFSSHSQGSGPSRCRNIGLSHAEGEYIVYLDADDVLTSNCFEERLKEANDFPGLDGYIFNCGTFHEAIGDSRTVWKVAEGDHLSKFLKHDLCWNIMQPLWRRTFLDNTAGFDDELRRSTDVEFHIRLLALHRPRYKLFPDAAPNVYYRIAPERRTESQYEQLQSIISAAVYISHKYDGFAKFKSVHRRYFRCTFFEAGRHVQAAFERGALTPTEYETLWRKLTIGAERSGIFSPASMSIWQLQESLFSSFGRIKGAGAATKALLVRVP